MRPIVPADQVSFETLFPLYGLGGSHHRGLVVGVLVGLQEGYCRGSGAALIFKLAKRP